MVSEKRGNIFTRTDGRYFIYLPKALVEDTAFPFSIGSSVKVKVSFKPGEKKLIIEGYRKK
jgi:hypothetical protein